MLRAYTMKTTETSTISELHGNRQLSFILFSLIKVFNSLKYPQMPHHLRELLTLTQGHNSTWLGQSGIRTSNLSVIGWPALPPEPRPPMMITQVMNRGRWINMGKSWNGILILTGLFEQPGKSNIGSDQRCNNILVQTQEHVFSATATLTMHQVKPTIKRSIVLKMFLNKSGLKQDKSPIKKWRPRRAKNPRVKITGGQRVTLLEYKKG